MAVTFARWNQTPRRPAQRVGRVCLALGLCLFLLTLCWPVLARAAQDAGQKAEPSQLCLAAAAQAANTEDVPLDVLVTIALIESGRDRGARLAPWPWAIHARGRGYWPDQRADALERAQAALDAGLTNIDLGCFQINYHWHGAQFDTLEAMLDPVTNARYAARLLRGHRDRLGSWDAAVGAYHSRTPDLAAAYRARFVRLSAHAAILVARAQTPPQSAALTRAASRILPATAGAIALHLVATDRPFLDGKGARQ